jgi:hypothetical protein
MDPNTPMTPAPRPPWPRAWPWAIVLAVGVFGAHATTWWWMPALAQALFGDIPTPADAPPLLVVLLGVYIVLSLAGGVGLAILIGDGLSARDQHRWQQAWDAQEWERQRLAQIRDQLWLESLPEADRERILERRREEHEREQRARALFEAEQQAIDDGRPPPR